MLLFVNPPGLGKVENQDQVAYHIKRGAENNIVSGNFVGQSIKEHCSNQQHIALSGIGFTGINRTGDEKKIKNALDQHITPLADRNNPLVVENIDHNQADSNHSHVEHGFLFFGIAFFSHLSPQRA